MKVFKKMCIKKSPTTLHSDWPKRRKSPAVGHWSKIDPRTKIQHPTFGVFLAVCCGHLWHLLVENLARPNTPWNSGGWNSRQWRTCRGDQNIKIGSKGLFERKANFNGQVCDQNNVGGKCKGVGCPNSLSWYLFFKHEPELQHLWFPLSF